jgi:hypothetical protein
MEGQLLAAELAVLLQDAAAQDLFGGQPFTTGVVALGFDQVLIDKTKNTGIGIYDLRNLFELSGNRIARNGGKKIRLAEKDLCVYPVRNQIDLSR